MSETEKFPGEEISLLPPAPVTKPPVGGVIDPAIVARVTVALPEPWVVSHDVPDAPHADRKSYFTHLLVDVQHHAERRARYWRAVYRLENLRAVSEAAQWRIDFDPKTQRVVIHSLSVRRGAEAIEQAEISRFRFLQREAGLEQAHTLSGHVTLMLLLEDVRVGDTLDVSYTVETQQELLPQRYWLAESISSELALRTFRLSVIFPEGFGMVWKAHDASFGPRAASHPEGTMWTWLAENLKAQPAEEKTPEWYSEDLWVQASNCADWGEVAAAYLEAWRETWDAPELKRAAEEIAAGTPSLPARVRRAISMVQDDLRYLSVNIELGGQIPTVPGGVLRRRYGDCKDKAFLLAHLLRLLGVPARPVLVHTRARHRLAEWLPRPACFNHAILEYELQGQRRWVDATHACQGGPALERPAPDFRVGLPISAGVTSLETMAPAPQASTSYELRETFLIDTTEKASQVQVQVIARGAAAEALRLHLLTEGEHELATFREHTYQRLYAVARRSGRMEWRDDRRRNELVLGEVYDLPEAVVPLADGRTSLFPCYAHTILGALSVPDGKSRRAPLALPHPCQIDHYVELVAPDLPSMETRKAKLVDPAFSFRFEPKQVRGRWLLHYHLLTTADHVPAARFERHKRSLQTFWSCLRLHFLLPRGTSKSWRPKAARSMLPAPPVEPAHTAPSHGDPMLPEEPAPILSSLPGAAVKEVPMPARAENKTASTSEVQVAAVSQSKSTAARRADSGIAPLAAASSSKRRGRRDESKLPIVLTILIVLQVLFWALKAMLRISLW